MRAMATRPVVPALLVVLLGLLAAAPAGAEVTVVDGGVRFTYTNAAAASVVWAGQFNNWSTTANPLVKDGDVWSVVLPLGPGEHQYKFVVDGQWTADPENPVTAGEYGNSAVRIGADGRLVAQAATSNTALSPKILVGGRVIGLFVSREDPAQDDRLELTRPDFDFDLNFGIRMSDVLEARLLTNIRSQTEDVQFFKSRLHLDRGSLHLHSDRIDLYAFDNDRLPTWEDPLHLVGNVGIYNHDYGYNQQGMQARRTIGGVDLRVLYSDNFRPGGTGRPSLDEPSLQAVLDQIAAGRLFAAAYKWSDTDNDKDVLAARATRSIGGGLTLGASARLDRGQNPGTAAIIEMDTTAANGDFSALVRFGPTLERWYAVGGDAEYKGKACTLRAGYLHGRNVLDFVSGSVATQYTAAGTTVTSEDLREVPACTLSRGNRARLDWSGKALGLDVGLGWEFHGERISPPGNDSLRTLDNSQRTWSLAAGRGWALSGGRKAGARLGLSIDDFSYDRTTPWRSQFWFDRNNYWLEAGEHQVRFDRMVMLGGRDVVSWQPSFSVDILSHPGLNFRYAGTFNAVSFDTRPKYIESLFQATLNLTAKTKLYSDTRWAKYDDPVLDLSGGYLSTFLEMSYDFTPGITFALSWGVDPYVIDAPVNEYAYVGRDQFLFGRDATGARAQDNFYSLADLIPAAEKALRDERRIQLEAIVRF